MVSSHPPGWCFLSLSEVQRCVCLLLGSLRMWYKYALRIPRPPLALDQTCSRSPLNSDLRVPPARTPAALSSGPCLPRGTALRPVLEMPHFHEEGLLKEPPFFWGVSSIPPLPGCPSWESYPSCEFPVFFLRATTVILALPVTFKKTNQRPDWPIAVKFSGPRPAGHSLATRNASPAHPCPTPPHLFF